MHIRNYLRTLQRNWILIVGIVLVAVAASATYSILQTPQYQASVKVFVFTQSSGTTSELQSGSTFTQQAVKTYAALTTTPVVLDPVLQKFNMTDTAEELAKKVTATAPLDTTIIDITVTNESAADAATLANAIGDSLSAYVPTIVPQAADGTAQVKISTVQPAAVPIGPSSPNVILNIALGLIVGLLIGLGLAFLREALDNRIRSQRDVELMTTAPVLGGIFYDPKAAQRPLVVHTDPKSPQAESYRSLRTNLQFLDFGDLPQTFVITSSIASEGKSSTSSNLAIALADADRSVVVIDADLRRPRLASYLGLEGAIGLTDVLIGRVQLADALQQWGDREMYVLPAGSIPPNPSELLGGPSMKKLIAALEKEFDTVVIDAPPLLPVTDAAILAKATRGAIVVASAGKVHKAQLKSAIGILDNVGATVLGLILTMLPTRGADAYGYGHYSYTYAEDDETAAEEAPVDEVDEAEETTPEVEENPYVARRHSAASDTDDSPVVDFFADDETSPIPVNESPVKTQ